MAMQLSPEKKMSNVARFAWTTLCCNVVVVLWGAYVRATGSGSGCGDKWPNCGGEILGASAKAQTIIEFTHRMTSGFALLMVACLVMWCWRATRRGDWARYSAVLAAVFLLNEALLGAGLVLLGHLAHDQSTSRTFVLCLHFANTLLLLASLALTATWLHSGSGSFRLAGKPRRVIAVVVGLGATMLIGITGSVAALGDTLFPPTSLRSAFLQDYAPGAPFVLHLRIYHPVVVFIAGTYLVWLVSQNSKRRVLESRASIALALLLFVQIGIGMMNIVLLVPVWLQILHLLVADLFWIILVLASTEPLLKPAK